MKSILVKWFKSQGVRNIKGTKVEKIGFYDLCGYKKLYQEGQLEVNK